MKTPIFTGSCTAIITPYDHDGSINFNKMAELINFQAENGTAALVVCGTTGENATQTVEEHEEIVDFCTQHNNGRMKIIAGIGSNDTMTALRLGKSAMKSGADAVLMITPYYNKATQQGLVKHFSYVADRVDLPMILYNVPSRTGAGISVDTYKELSKHPNINGIKEASSDFTLFARTRAVCGDDMNIWCGNDDQIVPMMSLGALGVISVASNIVPAQVAEICRLCLDGNFADGAKLFLEYVELFSDLFIEVNPIPVKTAMNLMGMDVGTFRLPLCDMYPNNLEKLKAAMRKNGLIQ